MISRIVPDLRANDWQIVDENGIVWKGGRAPSYQEGKRAAVDALARLRAQAELFAADRDDDEPEPLWIKARPIV